MHYDSIEEAIKAAPDCTHVLTTGSKWRGSLKNVGKFQPVKYEEGEYKNAEDPIKYGCAWLGEDSWLIALDRTSQSTAEPSQADTICNLLDEARSKVTAARFDTASGHIPAHQFLESGVKHMKDRASQRDAEDGERSMRRCVEAFNALEGTNLTETQGWRFMVMLKMARSVSGDFTADDYEDMAAYSGLAGECASTQETN